MNSQSKSLLDSVMGKLSRKGGNQSTTSNMSSPPPDRRLPELGDQPFHA